MSRTTYWWNPTTKQLEDISTQGEPEPRLQLMTGGFYEGLQATDGTPIDTRARYHAYLKQTGAAAPGDFVETLAQKKAEREAFFKEGGDWRMKKDRMEDVRQAAYEVRQRGRRR